MTSANSTLNPTAHQKFFSLNSSYCVDPGAQPNDLLNDATCFLEVVITLLNSRLDPDKEWDAELQSIVYFVEMSRNAVSAAKVRSGLI
ncbi:hypothetical protein TDB9533_03573 [Thalassocella blandensis]|nr:hypothetical protein TDB9533_03573 [Thalassocella blandensis]